MHKSQNSCQMNLSGSSSSLPCDAGSKAGSSGGGAGGSGSGPGGPGRSYGIGGAFLHKQMLLMTRQDSADADQDRQGEQGDTGTRSPRTGGAGADAGTGTQITTPSRPESPLRKRLSSPFRMLRERSASRGRERERERANCEDRAPEARPEQDSSSSISSSGGPRAFTWLCRDRHKRRITL